MFPGSLDGKGKSEIHEGIKGDGDLIKDVRDRTRGTSLNVEPCHIRDRLECSYTDPGRGPQ